MLSLSAACSPKSPAKPSPGGLSSVSSSAVDELHALFDAEWERNMRESPAWASRLGDRRYNDRWADLSLEAFERRRVALQSALKRLLTIDSSLLPASEQLNYVLFAQHYRREIETGRYRGFLVPLTQREGVQTLDELHERLRFETVKDFEDWLARLQSVAIYVDQTIVLMRTGMAEGRLPSRVVMERVPGQIAKQIASDPKESPFYHPFASFPSTLSESDQRRLRTAATDVIRQTVVPAYQRLQTFFNDTYLPATRETVGIWDSPDGAAYYAHLVRAYTTTEMSPADVHELGQNEVKRIRGEMAAIIEDVGFKGSFGDFLTFLRTDPRFYYTDPDSLLQAYRATAKRIDPEIVRLFGRLPRAPYGVRPIPEGIAPDTTTAYYHGPAADGSSAGTYYVNLYKPEVRPKYEIEVLTAHEAVPGHHLQIALAQELGELPMFRRHTGFTAFIEGWALYSECLGDALGLYKDPYSKFGQLTYEMWRAVRLVVDTGIHHYKWKRQQAIDFFKANAPKTEHDIVNEIDRYISWPGQAVAYKVGELRIKALRQRAQEALGERFSIRAFHDAVLSRGGVPLDLLEEQIEAYIADAEQEAPGEKAR